MILAYYLTGRIGNYGKDDTENENRRVQKCRGGGHIPVGGLALYCAIPRIH